VTLEELRALMAAHEVEHLEFKEAKSNFDTGKLADYCVAIANEKGGKLILGVTDKHPRKIVGSRAYNDLRSAKDFLRSKFPFLRIAVEELQTPEGRVLVFEIPSRPIGMPLENHGAYLARCGESLVPMPPDQLRRIFAETEADFSATVCAGAATSDLDPTAVERFRELWVRKSGTGNVDRLSSENLLKAAGLLRPDGALTHAALVLFGTNQALDVHLSQAEVVFEYRSSDTSLSIAQRKNYREGFFLFFDDLWEAINARNDEQQFQDGLFVQSIRTFNERVIREAILNAVTHRDYNLTSSVFVRQFPRKMEIVSPGGFPAGVTVETMLDRHVPRNRLIAEAFERCGLVERAGLGASFMFRTCVTESKPTPDYSRSDNYQVSLALRGEVQNPKFLRFLERVGEERLASFSTPDFLVLDFIQREEPIPDRLKPRLAGLLGHSVIERVGRARGARYILSQKLYEFVGEGGVYTRKRGLDRETNKALLLRHIQGTGSKGCQLRELGQVLPALPRSQIQVLLRELKADGRIRSVGRTSAGRWYPGPDVQ